MRYHRKASTHYRAGKDYAHAAHLALVAHGQAARWQHLLEVEQA
jgi:hypothetical protein